MSNVEARRANRWCSCLAITLSNCATCVEANNVCECREESRVLSFTSENDSNADSSIAHAVINMVGMLIGTYISGLSS